MAKARREKTLADYVVIAISPALIMTLVGSLVFFLLELSYRGDFEFRVRWILGCFVLGAVLVARIAIEEGRAHASSFGGALILVVGLGVFRFVDALNVVVIVWILLAIIWWCAWKLTWDCTLIDDSEDASGEGLLEAAGLSGGPNRDASESPPSERRAVRAAQLDRNGSAEPMSVDPAARRVRPHAPGLWVVYFSLAALPLFGAGQLFIPAANTAGRAFGFQLLAVYVASAMGLLLTTSFLGLRRYLRQRKLQMPVAMTGTWLAIGSGLVAALLLLALLIPRPQGEYTLTALIDKIDAKAREASRLAVLRGDRAQGEGRRVGDQDQQAKQPGEGGQQHEQQPADRKQEGKAQGDGKQGEQENRDAKNQGQAGGQRSGEKAGKSGEGKRADQAGQKRQNQEQAAGKDRAGEHGRRGEKPQQQGQNQNQNQNQRQPEANRPPQANPGANPPSSPGLLTQLAPLVKWILYGLLAAVVLFVLVRYWSRLVEVLRQLWAELLSLFGRKTEIDAGTAADPDQPPAALLPSFSAYADPFFSGAARRMAPAQLVRYTFEALEAWAREQVVARRPEQTPLEFAQELGRRIPALSKDVTQTAQLYVQIAYTRNSPAKDAVEILERMWRRMQMGARV
jgi:hypothetical protein